MLFYCRSILILWVWWKIQIEKRFKLEIEESLFEHQKSKTLQAIPKRFKSNPKRFKSFRNASSHFERLQIESKTLQAISKGFKSNSKGFKTFWKASNRIRKASNGFFQKIGKLNFPVGIVGIHDQKRSSDGRVPEGPGLLTFRLFHMRRFNLHRPTRLQLTLTIIED